MHRDLKPANVLVDGDRFALADFGIARIADHPSSTTKGTVIGTLAYMAPEVIAGHEPTAALAQTLHALAQSAYSTPAGDQAAEQPHEYRPGTASRAAMPYAAESTRMPAGPGPFEDATHTVRRPPTQDQATWGQLQVDGPGSVSGDNDRLLAVPTPSDPNEPPERAGKRSRRGRRAAAITAAAAVLILGGIWLALNGSGSPGSASKASTSTDPVAAGLVASRTPPPRSKPTAPVPRTATMPDSTSAPSPELGTAPATQSAASPAPPSSGSSGANGSSGSGQTSGPKSACGATGDADRRQLTEADPGLHPG